MNIAEKIKSFISKFINKKNTKLLTDGTQQISQHTSNGRQEFISSLKVSGNTPQEPSIEDCICEFIRQYDLRRQATGDDVDIYKAFIGMFCDEEEIGDNKKNQDKLTSIARKDGYSILYQPIYIDSKKKTFMHIVGSEGVDEKSNDVEKLYINCQRKNIAALTQEIYMRIRQIVGEKMQMKCISEQLTDEQLEYESRQIIKNYQRNDRIVIYAENSSMANKIAEIINEIRNDRPELFEGSKSVPMLQKKFGFIGCAKEKRGANVQTPLGFAYGRTYNEYLSSILYQSIVSGFDREFSVDPSNSKEEPEMRMKQYIDVFPKLSKEQRASVLKKCKDYFMDICSRGKVETVYTKNTEISRNNDERNM